MTFDPQTHASLHVSWAELRCRDQHGTCYPIDWRETRGRALAAEFERIRAVHDLPIIITSAYRTTAWNQRVNGRVGSQHLDGRALDLAPDPPLRFEQLVSAVMRVATGTDSAIRYVCIYTHQQFVHIDIRPVGALTLETAP